MMTDHTQGVTSKLLFILANGNHHRETIKQCNRKYTDVRHRPGREAKTRKSKHSCAGVQKKSRKKFATI